MITFFLVKDGVCTSSNIIQNLSEIAVVSVDVVGGCAIGFLRCFGWRSRKEGVEEFALCHERFAWSEEFELADSEGNPGFCRRRCCLGHDNDLLGMVVVVDYLRRVEV